MTKKTVAIFTTTEGHLSIAQSIESILKEQYHVVVFSERDRLFDLYLPVYQFFPGLYKYPFRLAQTQKMMQMARSFFKRKYQMKLRSFFRTYQPDLCISTYFLYNPVLEDLCAVHSTPFVNILTDPLTIHPLLIAEHASLNVVFDDVAEKHCQQFYPNAHYQKMGWLVRDEYQQPYDLHQVREQLHLHQNIFTMLLVTGSEGTNVAAKILPSLLRSRYPMQVVIACGGNKIMYKSAKALTSFLRKIKSRHYVIPLKFTPHLYRYMQAADLVVGKAGPNTLFESVATLTPFFATTHIAGQEDGNLEIIQTYELGYVEEKTVKATKKLKKIIAYPQQLEKLKSNLEKLATYNRGAKAELLSIVQRLIS